MTGYVTPRNSAGLQELLFCQLDGLEAGTVTPQHARAVSSVAGQVIASARLEIDYARYVSENRTDGGRLKPLPMADIDRIE